MKTLTAKQLDHAIGAAWHKQASGIQIAMMDIPKIFADVRRVVSEGIEIHHARDKAIHRYQHTEEQP